MAEAIAAMSYWSGDLWPYLVVILFGFLPSEVWRALAVFFVKGISEDSDILVWVRAVASALLAGVVAKILMSPSGALAAVPLFWRWMALFAGVGGFYLFRRSILMGVVTGEVVLVLAGFMFRA